MTATQTIKRRASDGADAILGISPAIKGLRELVRRVAKTDASVMICGPSGSGKEVAARAVHDESARAQQPFVAINCGAIPPDLIESELFGHERGAFTGAATRRIGRFEEANGGTLFLDEIGDMRFDTQVKLLRVLETGIISRVGGNAAIKVDVRIVCATHQDMQTAIDAGRFREDLYFRLCVVPLDMPDLASRNGDIPLLVEHFQRRHDGKGARFLAEAIEGMRSHAWPGNVRELRNVVERTNALYPGEAIDAKLIASLLDRTTASSIIASSIAERRAMPKPQPQSAETAEADPAMPIDLKGLLETMELERIQMALDMADGVISEAARLLTLKRTTLIEKMRKYGVDKSC